jgi:transcriptional regulator with XRE-family HTH domain
MAKVNRSTQPASWNRFGDRLRQLRLTGQISQRDLAARVGIDFTYLSKLENGRGEPPSVATVRRIAAELGADPEELLAFSGKVPAAIRDMADKDLRFAYFINALPMLSREQLGHVYAAANIESVPLVDDETRSRPKVKRIEKGPQRAKAAQSHQKRKQ